MAPSFISLCLFLPCLLVCEGIIGEDCRSALEEDDSCASEATILLQTHLEVRNGYDVKVAQQSKVSGLQAADEAKKDVDTPGMHPNTLPKVPPAKGEDTAGKEKVPPMPMEEGAIVDWKRKYPKRAAVEFRLSAWEVLHNQHKHPFVELTRSDCLNVLVTCAALLIIAGIGALPEWRYQSKAAVENPKAADVGEVVSAACDDVDHLVGGDLPELHEALAKGGGIAALVEARAQERPTHDALVDGRDGSSISYGQLDASVKALAQKLTAAGLGERDVVAVFLPQSPGLVVSLLALMRVGITWLTMDPETPAARLKHLLKAAGARLTLYLDSQEPIEALADVPAWSISPKGSLATESPPTPAKLASPEESPCPPGIAAIFFTSGSSGTPKGVLYGTETLLHGVLSMKRLCSMDHSTVAVLKTPVIWAVLEYEAFPALVAGGTIVCDDRCQKDLVRLAELVATYKVTTLMTSAPVMKAEIEGPWAQNAELLQAAAGSLRDLVNVGAGMPIETCMSTNAVLPQTKIHNLYGCTESVTTTWTYVKGSDDGNAPAGCPSPECTVHVLGPDQKPVPRGEIGEIYLGSTYNSHGYLGDKELTSTKFLGSGSDRRYRTGDLGSLVPDRFGKGGLVLEVTGRADRQLNISGVRVAPEEVESAIMSVEGVADVSVVQGGKSIVAFFSGKLKDEDLKTKINDHCIEVLLPRMRPALLLQLETFPRLRNGKIDLKTLGTRAEEAAGESLVQAVDSLGLMKNVSKDALLEVHTLAAMRGLAMVEVILFHWWWRIYAVKMSSNIISPEFEDDIQPGCRWFLRGNMQSQWAMVAFVLSSARTDRQAAEEKRPGQMRELVLVWAMMLFACWFLPELVQMSNVALGNGARVYDEPQPRWYLLLWIVCRFYSSCILLPLDRVFQRIGALGTATRALLVLVSAVYTYKGGMWLPLFAWCNEQPDTLSAKFCRWNYPTAGDNNTLCQVLIWMYVAAWFYQTPIVSGILKYWPKHLGPGLPLFCFVAGTTAVGYIDEIRDPMWIWREHVGTLLLEMPLDTCLLGFLVLTLYLAASTPWLQRLGLVMMGNCSLGTYIIHFFFFMWVPKESIHSAFAGINTAYFGVMGRHLPLMHDAVKAVRWAGGFAQLIVVLAYAVIFSLTIGNVFQKAFLATFTSVEKGVTRILRPLMVPTLSMTLFLLSAALILTPMAVLPPVR